MVVYTCLSRAGVGVVWGVGVGEGQVPEIPGPVNLEQSVSLVLNERPCLRNWECQGMKQSDHALTSDPHTQTHRPAPQSTYQMST